jgi:hypothetical protein
MPRSLPGLVLAGALVLAGCSLGGSNLPEPEEATKITQAQLEGMVLPAAELGTIAAGTKPAPENGAVGNAESAEDSLDPNDTGRTLRSAGRLAGHKAYFGGNYLAVLEKRSGLYLVGSEVELMEDPVYAAQYLHKQLGDFQRFNGKQSDGTELSGVSSFQVTGVGDEAGGLRATSSKGRQKLHITAVAFRRERIVAVAAIVRADKDDVENDVRALAVKLDHRIQDVLAGRLSPRKAEPSKEPQDVSVAATERLPDLTLHPEDVGPGVVATSEGGLEERTYVGYQRTFDDVVVGGSHLIRLQVQTAAYEKPAQAAVAHELVTQGLGRRIVADGIARAFARETSVTPTDIRVRALETGVRGQPGVVATFKLVGAKFKLVSIFVRSGRFVQSVTGICRPTGVDPDDLEVLAHRAQTRLVA